MNFQPLKDFLDYYLPMLGVPGSDTVIYKNHEEIFRYQSGFDSIRFKTPVRENALYNMYSCTKVSTAICATQLIERGEILINDPIYAYFPEWRDVCVKVKKDDGSVEIEKAKNPVLIKHLLSMTAGMNYNVNCPSIKEVQEKTDGKAPTLDIVRALANEPLDFEPGSQYQYSLCLDVIGGLIELVSGKKLSQYMKDNIFDPLDMKDSTFYLSYDLRSRMACQYNYNDKEGIAEEISIDDNKFRLGTEYESGGAGLISSVNDQIILADCLTHLGKGKNGNRILSEFGVNLMRANQLTEEQRRINFINHLQGYGYGFGVRTNLNPEMGGNLSPVGEFGWDGAKLSYLSCDPTTKVAFFHAEHMGGLHRIVIPRIRNIVYKCIEEY